ncbi:U-box domain-containing protein 13-like isoform X2 [Trifolium pratense]|uniref:U-box domain-containing protein 13-like isoform X2 n=1 Tax=Trifolium pratense TaxID=57577 RepID=UPI001E692B56|nr:U-box domain-containing protein 13-like isoform X2 [Trifolium pratense]
MPMAQSKTFIVLLRSLIHIATEISQITTFNPLVKNQCFDLSRRINFLVPLFHHLINDAVYVPCETIVSLQLVFLSAKDLLLFFSQSSQLYMILEREKIKFKFNDLASRFEQAIIEISFDKLDISEDLKEQVSLVTAQFRRAKEQFDLPCVELYEHLLSIYNQSCDVNTEPAALRLICEKLQFVSLEDIKQESIAIHKMIVDGHGFFEKSEVFEENTQGLSIVLKKIEDFLLKESENNGGGCFEKTTQVLSSGDLPPHTDETCMKLCCQSLVVPEEFRCPISLELMKDPVIISTGQTYERACIKKWLDAGHQTCPITQQIISSHILIPNHALYSLISNWCEANGVEPPRTRRVGNFWICKETSDGSSELINLDTLIRNLTSSYIEDQRSAAGEFRILAKHTDRNRNLIGEAGAIPLLVDLLYTPDVGTQEHAVTALLNLSIYDENKERIMASDAVPGILHVLKNGSMQARENAAATFFSLSKADENKLAIGASGAIKALVALFCEGSPRGKLDAATALFKLCLIHGNKGRAIKAGIVPKLVEMLTEPGGEMRDGALAIMALIVSHPDAIEAFRSTNAIPILVEFINNGSLKNKENATSVLMYLCRGDPYYLSIVASLGVINPLLELTENGSERGMRKAAQLLELLGIGRPL